MVARILTLLVACGLICSSSASASDAVISLLSTYHEGTAPSEGVPHRTYPWQREITATIFWVGEKAQSYHIDNLSSAWDVAWEKTFGGMDAPNGRVGYLPGNFVPHCNPFYVALPFNDLKCRQLAAQWVPWWNPQAPTNISQCCGRWIEIHTGNGKICYAQWEDAGPFRYDDAPYVFDPKAATMPQATAGIDVSPAVGTFLGLDGHDIVDWRFVESCEVPSGPWVKHEECVPALEKLVHLPVKEIWSSHHTLVSSQD